MSTTVNVRAALFGVLLVFALAGCGSSGGPPSAKTVVQTVTAPPAPSASTSSPAPGSSSYDPYTATLYTAKIPSGWRQEADQEQHSGYVESKWRDPSDPNTSITVDAAAGESTSPGDKATSVRAALHGASGYSERDFASTTVAGKDAWKWTFDVSGDRRVDYFLADCSTGVAVLGSTSPGKFSGLQATFRHVAGSVHIDCSTQSSSPAPEAPPSSPTQADTQPTNQDFCATHDCIPNFDNGTGSIVQCNDGMWSHSGGRPGACSHHSGESSTTYP